MSKRESATQTQDGYSIFVKDLEGLGYIPEGVVNWVALMGWSLDDHTEFFTLRDLVEKFNLSHLNPAPAAINFSKLDYFNGMHIRNLGREDLAQRLAPTITRGGFKLDKEILYKAIPIIRERLVTLDDVIPVAGFLFMEKVVPNPSDLIGDKLTAAESANIARRSYEVLASLPTMSISLAEPPMRAMVDELGYKTGQVFGIIRVAVTGQKVSPPLFETMEIIGKEKVLARIQNAIELLEGLVKE